MPRDRFTDFLSKDELAQLTRTSNAWGWWTLAVNWALIAGAFALAIAWPNPLTIVLAVLVIAGRQLGLGIIVHDCAHHALFSPNIAPITSNIIASPAPRTIPISASSKAIRSRGNRCVANSRAT